MMMRLETEKMLAQHFMNLAYHEKEVQLFQYSQFMQIERERIVLNEHYRFQPAAAFKRIDRLNNKKINSYDLATFMRDNGYNYYSVDLGDVIRAYDADNDGHLDFIEFTKLMVTSTDLVLQKRAHERYEEYVGFRDSLAPQVETSMALIIVKELEGLKMLNREKEVQKSRYDFSRLDAFRAIDMYKLNSIMRADMKAFFVRNGIEATILDADYLFKRLDLDNDGVITYQEFCDYVERVGANIGTTMNENQVQVSPRTQSQHQSTQLQTPQRLDKQELSFQKNERLTKTETKKRDIPSHQEQEEDPENEINEIERNYLIYGIREKNATPLKRSRSSTPNQTSPSSRKNVKRQHDNSEDRLASMVTTPSPTKQGGGFQSPESRGAKEARQLDLDDIEEEEKENQDSLNSEANHNNEQEGAYEAEQQQQQLEEVANGHKVSGVLPPLDQNEEQVLAEVLKNLIFLENDIEKSKLQLALKADFNLLDAFRLFDKYEQGEINKFDLEDGFKKLGVYNVNKADLDLFFKRYDTNADYKLRFNEFTEALTPKDRIYAEHLSNKRPNYEARNPEEAMTLKTLLDFGDTIRVMLRCETQAEEMRQSIARRQRFSISAAFQTLDRNNNGFISKVELRNFLEFYEFYATPKEIELLFTKMDKDRDEKVSYGEFFSELSHRLPF